MSSRAETPDSPSGKALAAQLRIARNTSSEAEDNAVTLRHLEILFGGVSLGGLDFGPLFSSCMRETDTAVAIWKLPTRVYRAFNLGQYFLRSLQVPGARVECGALKGFSTLLLCHLMRAVDSSFAGAGLYVVDSFEGLSEPKPQDAVDGRFPNTRGAMACPLDQVKRVLSQFPKIEFHKGWIPDVLATLPETPWSFVHIDVDLYEPTLACLEYFVPRLAPGGIIVNDDYSSPLFPGGGLAWDEFCKKHRLSFAALNSGQAVLIDGA